MYWFSNLGGFEVIWRIVFNGVIFALGGAAALLIRRMNRDQDETLSLSLTGRTPPAVPESPQISLEVLTYLAERLLIVGALLGRSGRELFPKIGETTDNQVLSIRGFYNEFLRQSGLWDKCELDERSLLSVPEGEWTDEQKVALWTWFEHFRLLRWLLRLDEHIDPLAHFPKPDFNLLKDLPNWRVATLVERDTLKSWDLRAERDFAAVYTLAATAEAEFRGLVSASLDDPAFHQIRDKYLAAPEDFLAGVHTFRELEDDALRVIAASAMARAAYASYLVELLAADAPFSFASWQELASKT